MEYILPSLLGGTIAYNCSILLKQYRWRARVSDLLKRGFNIEGMRLVRVDRNLFVQRISYYRRKSTSFLYVTLSQARMLSTLGDNRNAQLIKAEVQIYDPTRKYKCTPHMDIPSIHTISYIADEKDAYMCDHTIYAEWLQIQRACITPDTNAYIIKDNDNIVYGVDTDRDRLIVYMLGRQKVHHQVRIIIIASILLMLYTYKKLEK